MIATLWWLKYWLQEGQNKEVKEERSNISRHAYSFQFWMYVFEILQIFCWNLYSIIYKCMCPSVYIVSFFHCRDSLVQQQLFKHFTVAPNNDRALNKPSWESFYFRENSDNAAWTRSGREIRKNDMKNVSWLSSRRESTNLGHPCKNSWRC